jgi:DoxX-like family
MIHILLWVVQSFLAVAFVVAGGTKLAKGRAVLLDDPSMAWARDYSSSQIKGIALAEVFGAIGLIARSRCAACRHAARGRRSHPADGRISVHAQAAPRTYGAGARAWTIERGCRCWQVRCRVMRESR